MKYSGIMNYEYEQAYHDAIEELYASSIEIQKHQVVIEGMNEDVFKRYQKAWESFSQAQKKFFGDTLKQK